LAKNLKPILLKRELIVDSTVTCHSDDDKLNKYIMLMNDANIITATSRIPFVFGQTITSLLFG